MPANRPPSSARPLSVDPLHLLWVLSAATLAVLLAYLHAWPQAPYPLNGVAPALGLIVLAAAAVLMVARCPNVPVRTLAPVLFPSALFLWALWRTAVARVPAEGTAQLGTLLEGLLVFSVALVLSAIAGSFPSFGFRPTDAKPVADLPKHSRQRGDLSEVLSGPSALLFLNAAITFFLVLAAAVSLWAVYEYFVRYELQFIEFSLEIKRQGRSLSNLTPREWALLDALRSRRVGARFGNPNVLAGFLAMIAPLALAAAATWRDRLARIGAAATLGLIWFVVLLSGSRGGMLTLLAATLAGAAVLGRSTLQKEFRIVSFAGVLCVCAVLGAYVLPASKPPEQAAGLPAEAMPRARYSFFERLRTAPGIRQRMFYFRSAAAMIRTSPWLGQGLGSYAVLYPRYKHPQAGEARYPHNIVLHLLVETGVVGLTLWAGWVVVVAAAAVRQLRAASSGSARIILAALLVAVLAYLFNNLMEITWTFRETWLDWCLLAGIVAGYDHAGRPPGGIGQVCEQPKTATAQPFSPFVSLCLRRAGLILIAVPLAIGLVFSNACLLRPLLGEAAELAAGDLLREEPTPQVNAEILRLSLKAIRYQPRNPWYRDWLACFYRDTGRFDEAREQFREALRLHPDSAKIRMDFARLEQMNKRYDEARRLLTEAVALYPHARYRHLLAQVEREAGNLEAAREHYRAAMASSLDAREAAAIRADFADLERKSGRLDEARQLLQEAVRTYPMNAQYHYLLADLAREAGDLAAARRHIDDALKYASGAEEKVRFQQFRRQMDETEDAAASP